MFTKAIRQIFTNVYMQRANFCTNFSTENKLLKSLQARIEATGPMSVSDYMKEVLVSPQMGYYMSRDVFGSSGDFITSPEISQIFGEMIGVWFYNEWYRIGKPQPLQLVEFGPGRGTLADDILRVFGKLMPKTVDLSVHFVELSPHLRRVQMSKLCSEAVNNELQNEQSWTEGKTLESKYGFPLSWHSHLTTVPEAFSLFLAHEFFDAIPIFKFQKTAAGWREILIDFKDDKMKFVISRSETPAVKYLINKKSEIMWKFHPNPASS